MWQLQIDGFSPLFDFTSLEKTYLTFKAENCTADLICHLGYPIYCRVKIYAIRVGFLHEIRHLGVQNFKGALRHLGVISEVCE